MMGLTLCKPSPVEGIGLHTGARVRAMLIPRDEFGIIFRRSDLPDAPSIPATPVSLAPSKRGTTLRCGAASISTVEHLLAACWGLHIAGLCVEVDGPELPIGDGSALLWVEAFQRAGMRPISMPPSFIPQPIAVAEGEASITLAPAARWSVHFAGVFPDGARQEARWGAETDFAVELAGARTFCRLSEVGALRRAGLIRGGSPANSLVWMDISADDVRIHEIRAWWPNATFSATPEGLLAPQRLRWPDECARHKLLDLLGDLALARPLAPCQVEAVQSGHALTHRLVKILHHMEGMHERTDDSVGH